jgi:hypothetical protein
VVGTWKTDKLPHLGEMRFSRGLLLILVAVGIVAVLVVWYRRGDAPTTTFVDVVRVADVSVVFEGLPHQGYEGDLLEKERRTKPVEELGGYPFYKEPLQLTDADAKRLSKVLSDSSTLRTWSGEKKCDGFHPDFAAAYQQGTSVILICFGCQEAQVVGPLTSSRHDLDNKAYKELKNILSGYRKNRPASRWQQKPV